MHLIKLIEDEIIVRIWIKKTLCPRGLQSSAVVSQIYEDGNSHIFVRTMHHKNALNTFACGKIHIARVSFADVSQATFLQSI